MSDIDTQLDEILKEHFYIGEHTQCDESCSKKWYEENNIKEAKQAIKQLIEKEIREFIKPHLDYCMEQNGMRYCKNCKLEDPFVTEEDYMENK